MAIKDIFKVSRKTFFNPTEWIDLQAIRFQNMTFWAVIKALITPEKAEIKETFEQAMQRMGLNEEDLKEAQQSYASYALFFLLCAIGIAAFSFYLLFVHRTVQGWLLGLATAGLSLVQAFRFDFWSFQIKHRKLGCTFAEWKQRKPFN